jgi:hypothetical protein
MRRLLRNLFAATPARPAGARLGLERLDDRLVPAVVTYYLDSGNVAIEGTDAPDVVEVLQSEHWLEIRVDGRFHTFRVSDVSGIYFYGFGGNDTFENGSDKRDYAVGGPGNDTLIGGLSHSTFFGGEDDDRLEARRPADLLGDGSTMMGGPGTDTLIGSDCLDSLRGDEGNDTIYGDRSERAPNSDAVLVHSMGDFLDGGDGSDHLYGREGQDTLRGGTGWDLLYGGNGADHLDAGWDYDGDYLDGGYTPLGTVDTLRMYHHVDPVQTTSGALYYPSYDAAAAWYTPAQSRVSIQWVRMPSPPWVYLAPTMGSYTPPSTTAVTTGSYTPPSSTTAVTTGVYTPPTETGSEPFDYSTSGRDRMYWSG